MPKTVRVNVRALANTAAVRREKRNGRDVIIVPSATMPDDVVMNGIRYEAAEIEKSFMGLSRSPAPLGHPMVNGKFVSARDPEGINVGWVGAWNENVRRENGRVLLDKVIDVARANESDGGKRVLAAIDAQQPIHTSTGLLCHLHEVPNDSEADFAARDITFDHDAILLDEEGAATPEQGVGIFVNSAGASEEIEVINSALDDAERELDWAVDSIARAVERREKAGALDRMKTVILEALGFTGRESSTEKESDVTVSKEQFETLSAKVNSLADSVANIGDTIAAAVANAVKPLVDAQQEAIANAKAAEEAEQAELVGKVVAANLLSEADAKAAPIATLKALVANAKPGTAAPALGGGSGGKPITNQFKLPKGD